MIYSSGLLTKCKTSLSRLIDIGSSVQVNDLDEDMLLLLHEGQLDKCFPNSYQD